tara:strand:- start:550 stop:2316 length:1767 start_codon:yes stop_codon:yes gene_type:complete
LKERLKTKIMDNKKVLNEVSRIKEVMGILNEGGRSTLVKGMVEFIDDILKISSKSAVDLADEFGDDGARLLRELTSKDESVTNRGIGNIIEDMRKLPNSKAFDDTLAGLRLSLDDMVDETGDSIIKKITQVKNGVESLIKNDQNIAAAEYFNKEFKNVAKWGDKSLERFIKDEYFFKSIPGFSKNEFKDMLKIATTKISKKGGTMSKLVKFKEVLTSYLKSSLKYSENVIKDVDSYIALRKEASKLTGQAKLNAITKANRFVQRIELNLGILNRKNKEAINALIEELSEKRNKLPRLTPEREKLSDVITKLKSEDADILKWQDYLPKDFLKEALEIRARRVDALKKFWPEKLTLIKRSPKTAARIKELGVFEAFFRIFSGDVLNVVRRLYKNPKKLARIIGTEFGSRLLGLPLVLGGFETIMDFSSMSSNPTSEITPQWLEDNPELAKTLQNPGIIGVGGAGDYKDYDSLNWSIDMLANLTNNTMKKFNITIPIWAIIEIMGEISETGGGANYFKQQFERISTIRESDEFKNASPEERLKMLNKVQEDAEGRVETFLGYFLDSDETIMERLNKALAEIENANAGSVEF